MNLCSEGHDEVCYESRHCPVCEVRDDLNIEIETLKSNIGDLEVKVIVLQETIGDTEHTDTIAQ